MIGRIAILSDIHFPYQCPRAWPLTLSILPRLNLDAILLNGDIIDFEPISKFVECPRKKIELKPHLDESYKQLLRLRKAVPKVRILKRPGNHEERMDKHIVTKAPSLIDLAQLNGPLHVASLLKVDQLDIEWIANDRPYRPYPLGKLDIMHGHELKVSGKHTAEKIYRKIGSNMYVGHLHEFDRYIQRVLRGPINAVWVGGCLCNVNPDWTFFPQWQQGFGVVEVSRSGLFHVEQHWFYERDKKLYTQLQGKEYCT